MEHKPFRAVAAHVAVGFEWTAALRPPFKFENLREFEQKRDESVQEQIAVRSMSRICEDREAAAALPRCVTAILAAVSAVGLKPRRLGCPTDESSGESVCSLL